MLSFEDVRVFVPTQSLVSKRVIFNSHHLTFQLNDSDFSIMYRAIDGFRLFESSTERRFTPSTLTGHTVAVYTKDFHIYELTVNYLSVARSLEQALEAATCVNDISLYYPFTYKLNQLPPLPVMKPIDWPNNIKEILSVGNWRLSQVNENYAMCNTYPKTLIVPAKCDDQMLIESSRFRNGGRFPLLVYYHKPRQTTLLITAEPITTQFINVSNQNISTQLSSNPSSSVLSTIANSSFTTSLTSSKSSNLILNSSIKNSISPFNSTSNNRCRADEQLLSFVLPDKCRGISDSIGLLSNAALNPIGNFGLRNVVTTTNSSSISFDNSSINSLNNINEQQINTTVKNDIISNLNQLDIQSTNYTTVESNLSNINNNSNNSNINVKKSKKFSAWLSLVRETLAAAVAGATALDALDAFAQQQLQQEQCLLAEKQKKSSKVHVNEEVKLRGSCVLVQSRKGTDRAILLLRQYPNSFEFTDELLCVLAKHAYFSEYGMSYINQPIVINCFQNPFYSGQNNDKIQLPIVDGYACWPCLAAQALQQLVGDNPGLWKLPRYMSHVIVDKFETERLRSIQLRK
ncbi:Myotubularin-related protein 9-like [Schistosoma japonicum]|nr:Myotubularin-related protein 9-like [Schistosoma japonicum]